ncbi:MAG: hypothetical protein EOM69_01625 [Clostridia bacterium]|nr:hypothetical protein [Clostridia bacterium]
MTGSRIEFVGETEEALRRFTAPQVIDCAGHAVLPGLIDAHRPGLLVIDPISALLKGGWRAVVDAVNSLRIPLIEKVELFDIYEDEAALGKGKKSVAYSITYRDPKSTLTDEKVNRLHEKVRQHLVQVLGVELR